MQWIRLRPGYVFDFRGGGERLEAEAVAEAVFAELPLAAICAYMVYDGERFRDRSSGS
jgi:hypothetical protein